MCPSVPCPLLCCQHSPLVGEALERERFQSEVVASFAAGRQFGAAKATFEATNRMAIHLSLLMLYAWGGYLVSHGMMPIGVLVSGIGFTFSLMYATQGAVNTLSELRRASGAFDRVRLTVVRRQCDLFQVLGGVETIACCDFVMWLTYVTI